MPGAVAEPSPLLLHVTMQASTDPGLGQLKISWTLHGRPLLPRPGKVSVVSYTCLQVLIPQVELSNRGSLLKISQLNSEDSGKVGTKLDCSGLPAVSGCV